MLSDHFTERLEYIFNNMDDAVCITDKKGFLLYANPAAEKLFGLNDYLNIHISKTIPYVDGNDALIQLFIDTILQEQKSRHAFVDYYNNQGKRFFLQVSMTFKSDDPPMFLLVVSDLTRLEKVEAAFARYTSPEIAKYVLTKPGGEKRGGSELTVSILISDLRGFSELSRTVPASDLILILNHYFEAMSAIIIRYQGTVIEFLGDGIFVVFGAPDSLPDHAEKAVRCAIEMQNAMREVNAWNLERNYPPLEMGIGINSGEAVVGNIGSEFRMKYGCMGPTVNLASRIETYTVGGQIYISEHTRSFIRKKLVTKDEKAILPKGEGHPIHICSVTGIGDDLFLHSPAEKADWAEDTVDLPIIFYRMDEKKLAPATYSGRLIKLTRDEKYALLSTSDPLDLLENLMLRLCQKDFYAKVVAASPEGTVICFTSKPVLISSLILNRDGQ